MREAIVVIGGYNSFWPVYLKTARDLEDVSGLQAIGVPLMPWDWWAARQAGEASNILQKIAHSRKFTWDWYGGSAAIIRRWWPAGVGDAR